MEELDYFDYFVPLTKNASCASVFARKSAEFLPDGTGETNQISNRQWEMATATDEDSFSNASQQLCHFCTWLHHHLLKPLAEGTEPHLPCCQENGLDSESRGDSILGGSF